MQELSGKIYEIIKDYHCDECNAFEQGRILDWANQFDETDREFILLEFLHLLNQGIYISKAKAGELLWENFISTANKLGYKDDYKKFIFESHFFNVQPEGKSQSILFALLNDRSKEKLGIEINTDSGYKTKNFIYVDDVLATGKSILKGLSKWLSEDDNSKKVISGEYKLVLNLFCVHTWGLDNLRISLKIKFNNDVFTKLPHVQTNYVIDNRVLYPSAQLNLAFPINEQDELVLQYFNALQPNYSKYEERAFRPANRPQEEKFFSSPENRNRFERIILAKGVEILNRTREGNAGLRPLGMTYPHHKTLGTGTLFFTWRNISNTCPLVFWWDVPAHGWKGLFPLKNRG